MTRRQDCSGSHCVSGASVAHRVYMDDGISDVTTPLEIER